MNFHVIIPARYQSTRLPGKILLDLAGQPIIQHVYQRARQSGASHVVIATDDERIVRTVKGFGADVHMTAVGHRSGTDRISEVIDQQQLDDEAIIVNVQGDEPLVPPEIIDQVAGILAKNDRLSMATLCVPLSNMKQLNSPNVVKVVRDEHNNASYFSRAMIPFDYNQTGDYLQHCRRHIGIYAYRASLLRKFVRWPIAPLERIEKLEQLRVLWQGVTLRVDDAIRIPAGDVNTMEDLQQLRQQLYNKI